VPERDSAVAAAAIYFEKTAYIQQLIAEKNKRANKVESLRSNQSNVLNECNKSKYKNRLKEKKTKKYSF
jgi:hypothetical protein